MGTCGVAGLAVGGVVSRHPAALRWFVWFVAFSLGTTESVGGDVLTTAQWTVPISALVALALFKPLGALIDATKDRVRPKP